ncbi:MAG: cyclophilin-like family protein [Nitrososphaeria archaeon]
MSTTGTVSKQKFRVTITGKGEVTLNLYRHLSPSTLLRINKIVPFETHAVRQNETVVMPTNIIAGKEKTRDEFKRGEIAFGLQEVAMIFFLKDMRVSRKYNILGAVESGLDVLDNVVHSETARVERLE